MNISEPAHVTRKIADNYSEQLAVIAKANGWTGEQAFDHTSAMDRDEFQVAYEASKRALAGTAKPRFIDPAKQATEKQWNFICSLAEQVLNECPEVDRNVATVVLEEGREQFTKKTASSMIDVFKDSLAKARQAAREQKASAASTDGEAPEGIHLESDTVFKVQVAVHGSGKKYAKALVPSTGEWQYMGREPLSRLSEATLMTLEQAKEFGHLYGMCARCGATLTREESIEAGIGPVCATKF